MGDATEKHINALVRRFGFANERPDEEWPKTEYDIDAGYSPFLIGTASAAHERAEDTSPQRFFGDLWRSGEVAVLCGEPGVGKSILATQIAETLARGGGGRTRQDILYFDFENTDEAFSIRYSCRPVPSSPERLCYQFSRRFRRASVVMAKPGPPKHFNDLNQDILYWIREEMNRNRGKVFIIDNVTYLTGKMSIVRVIKNIKLWAKHSHSSILIVAHTRTKRRPSPVTLADLSSGKSLGELAENVFALAPSTLGPDIRYVKSLKTRASGSPTGGDVLTFRLRRMISPDPVQADDSDNGSDEADDAAASVVYHPSQPSGGGSASLVRVGGALQPNAGDPYPFIGLSLVGPAHETDHLRDYQKEAALAERRHQAELKRRRTQSLQSTLTDAIIDGRYRRYILGE